jgi:hypothetical protein
MNSRYYIFIFAAICIPLRGMEKKNEAPKGKTFTYYSGGYNGKIEKIEYTMLDAPHEVKGAREYPYYLSWQTRFCLDMPEPFKGFTGLHQLKAPFDCEDVDLIHECSVGDHQRDVWCCQIALVLQKKYAVVTDNLNLKNTLMKKNDTLVWEMSFRDGKDVVRLYKRSVYGGSFVAREGDSATPFTYLSSLGMTSLLQSLKSTQDKK